ncbi:MAG: hypothetical protein QM817_36650 [Archangium sp.]
MLLFVLAGCKSQKVVQAEVELAAAKARVATLDKKRKDMTDELKRVEVSRRQFSQQADEAEVAKQRLVAAGLVIHGDPVPDSVLLEEALRAKSPKLGGLAASIVQRQLPCVDEKADDTPEEEGDPVQDNCGPPELEDACVGVLEETVQSFKWECPAVVKTPGARPVAVCLAQGVWRNDTWEGVSGPTNQTDNQLVRLALVHKNRLFVADWPKPSMAVYRPHNDEELAACTADNDDAQCIRKCDTTFGRLDDTCERYGDYGDDGPEYERDDEDPDVAAARRAAEQADAEAARAREELQYQECLSACKRDESDAEPEPVVGVRYSLSNERYPGVFLFDVEYDSGLEDGGVLPSEVVALGFDDALTEVTDPEAQEDDTVGELDFLLYVKALQKYDSPQGVVLFGEAPNGLPDGVLVSKTGKEAPKVLKPDEVCAAVPVAKQGAIAKKCAEPPPPPPAPAAVDAGVVVDGGAP